MLKLALGAIGIILGALCLVLVTNFVFASLEWEQFKLLHGKSYADPLEEKMRLEIFTRNKLEVERFNSDESTEMGYKRGLNHLSDRTSGEIEQLLGLRVPAGFNRTNSPESEAYLAAVLADDSGEPRASVDWRKTKGIVTPVKDQGQCGSCWAFSAVGVLEGQELKQTNRTKLIGLSEQNIMDCTGYPDASCDGGWPSDAIDQVHKEGGIQSEDTYRYTARDGTGCRFEKMKSIMTAKGHSILKKGDENQLMEVVSKYGPVSVCLDASQPSFLSYKSGVYKNKKCSHSILDHAVLIVGYGTDPNRGDYWLVKNSWTESWGEQGYMRIVRGKNMCGIAQLAAIATF